MKTRISHRRPNSIELLVRPPTGKTYRNESQDRSVVNPYMDNIRYIYNLYIIYEPIEYGFR